MFQVLIKPCSVYSVGGELPGNRKEVVMDIWGGAHKGIDGVSWGELACFHAFYASVEHHGAC